MTTRRLLHAAALAGSASGALGFIYIAGNAWFHPQSLSWPLTHFLPYPREDTFGVLCFILAALSLFVHDLTRE